MRSTLKQKQLAKNLAVNAVDFRYKTLKELLLASGYALTTSSWQAAQIIGNEGVQEELAKLGFNAKAFKARVSEILLGGDDSDSLRAAEIIAKTLGLYAPEKSITITGTLEVLKELENEAGIVRKDKNQSGRTGSGSGETVVLETERPLLAPE